MNFLHCDYRRYLQTVKHVLLGIFYVFLRSFAFTAPLKLAPLLSHGSLKFWLVKNCKVYSKKLAFIITCIDTQFNE